MRKRYWKKWLTGLLCVALLFSNVLSMEIQVSAAELESGTFVVEDEAGNTEEERKVIEGEIPKDEGTEEEAPKEDGAEDETPKEEEFVPDDTEKDDQESGGSDIGDADSGEEGTNKENRDEDSAEDKNDDLETEQGNESFDEIGMFLDGEEELEIDTELDRELMVTDENSQSSTGLSGKCGNNLTWTLEDGTLTISGEGRMDDYFSFDYTPWHSYVDDIQRLIIRDGVNYIGEHAFYGSEFSGNLTIPDSVIGIGDYAFEWCGFSGSLTIPGSVVSIGNSAFEGCRGFNGSLTIPDSVTSIGDYAFEWCDFSGSLTIPDSVISIGNSAFEGCRGFSGSLTIPDSVTSIGDSAFEDCSGFSGSLRISNNVTSIGNKTFSGCRGFSGNLTIPDSVTSIGGGAFEDCRGFSGSLTIPDSVASIGNFAFPQSFNYIIFKGDAPDMEPSFTFDGSGGSGVPIYYPSWKSGWNNVIGDDYEGALAWIPYSEGTHPWGNGSDETYLLGVLEAIDILGFNVTIDGKVYYVTDSFDMRKPTDILQNADKRIVCTVSNGKISEMETLGNVAELEIFLLGGKGDIVYQNGGYVSNSKIIQVSLGYHIKDEYKGLDIKQFEDIALNMDRIKLTLSDYGLNFGKKGWINPAGVTELEEKPNKQIALGETQTYEFEVFVEDGFEPPINAKPEFNLVIAVTASGVEQVQNKKIYIMNLDYQRQKAEAQKENRESKSDISKAKKELEKLCNGNYLALGVDLKYYLSDAQMKSIEEFLYCWIAEVNNSQTYDNRLAELGDNIKKEIDKKIMKKLGINPNVGFFWSQTEAITQVKAQTFYGEKTIEFTLHCGSLNSNGNTYASFGDIRYEILEKENITGNVPTEGFLGMTTYAGMDTFIKSMQDVAEDSIKKVYDEFWGKDANKVAGMLVDETIMKIIDKKFGSFSNGVYTLFTKPSKNFVKKIRVECPVDVYIYDLEDNLCGAIVSNEIDVSCTDVLMFVEDDSKIFYLTGDDYSLKLVGNDIGTMNYTIEELDEGMETLRVIQFFDLPLAEGKEYRGFIYEPVLIDSMLYSLTTDEGVIQPDTSSSDVNDRVFTEGIVIDTAEKAIKISENLKLSAHVVPENAANRKITWMSSDEQIATVNSEGLVTGVGRGKVIISAISDDGKFEAKYNLTVTDNPTDGDGADAKTYTVTFDLQGHGGMLEEYSGYVGIAVGSRINKPAEPIDNSYIFTGWYKDIQCIEIWNFETDVVEKDTVLYAGWKLKVSNEEEGETGNNGGNTGGSGSTGENTGNTGGNGNVESSGDANGNNIVNDIADSGISDINASVENSGSVDYGIGNLVGSDNNDSNTDRVNNAGSNNGSNNDIGSSYNSSNQAAKSTKDGEPRTEDITPVEIYATVAMVAGFLYLLLYFMEEGGMTEEEKNEMVAVLVSWGRKGSWARRYVAIAAILFLLIYYHSIGKRTSVEWKVVYGK